MRLMIRALAAVVIGYVIFSITAAILSYITFAASALAAVFVATWIGAGRAPWLVAGDLVAALRRRGLRRLPRLI